VKHTALLSLIIAVLVAGCATTDDISTTASPPAASESTAPSATSTPEPPQPSDNWATAEITEEAATNALKKARGGLAIKITDDTLRKISVLGGDIVIEVKPKEMNGERIYARQIGESMIAYARILFENPQVERVVLNGYVDTTDNDTVFGAQIIWTRATHEAVNYEDISTKALGDISAPYDVAEDYSLKPIVLNGLKEKDRALFEK
jgi:hypothetical protein